MFGNVIYYDKNKIDEYRAVVKGQRNLQIDEYEVSYDKRGLLPVDKGNVWYTPLLRIPVWQYRIFMAQMELVTQPIKEECAADEPKIEPQKALEATKKSKQPKDTEKPETAKIPPKEPEQEPMFSEGKGGQLSFF